MTELATDPGAATASGRHAARSSDDGEGSTGPTANPPSRLRSHFWLTLLGIEAIALVIRVVYVVVFTAREAPRLYDAFWYTSQADEMVTGQFFGTPFGTTPSAAHPPLTSFVITPTTYFFGDHAGEIPDRLTMVVIGLAVVLLVGLLGRSLAGPRVGLIAALLAAVYPNFWIPNGIIMSESLSMLVMVLILLAIYQLLRTPTLWHAALLGLGCGVQILVRAELVLFVPFLLIPAVLACGQVGWPKRLALAGVGLIVCLLTVMPWVGRNLATFHDATYVSTSDGLGLLGSNCPATYSGPGLGTWSLACAVSVKTTGDESVQSARLQNAAVSYIKKHESRLPVVAAARVGRLWDFYMPIQQAAIDVNEGRPQRAALVGLWFYYALLPFAALGIWQFRRRHIVQWPLLVPAGVLTVVAAVFYGTVRFRAPFEVSLVLLAAAGIDGIVRGISRPRRGPELPSSEGASQTSEPMPQMTGGLATP
jgi:4-amino-4-deoxy-L-arabinose transferase-like glycosyltransferase